MLYTELPRFLHPRKRSPASQMHYFDSAELLHRLLGEGRSRAEAAALCGMSVPQAMERVRLMGLEDGLRAYLRAENAPEQIARCLLTLPDPALRQRVAQRIVQERLCIRDAALLVAAAGRSRRCQPSPQQPRVIAVIRDIRLYRNAVRDIAGQMNAAGVRATFTERKTGSMQELTIAYPARRRRTERYQAM